LFEAQLNAVARRLNERPRKTPNDDSRQRAAHNLFW